jgi:hypothetical protein
MACQPRLPAASVLHERGAVERPAAVGGAGVQRPVPALPLVVQTTTIRAHDSPV